MQRLPWESLHWAGPAGAGAAVVDGAGVGSGSGSGAGSGSASGSAEPAAHWHRPAWLQGHQACPWAHAEHAWSLAAWALPGTATHSPQPLQNPALDGGGAGVLAGCVVAGGVCAGVVEGAAVVDEAVVGCAVDGAAVAVVVVGDAVGEAVGAAVGAADELDAILKSAQFRNASGYELGELPVMYSHWRVHGASCVQTRPSGRNILSVYLPPAPALGLGSVQRALCPLPDSPQSPPLLQQLPSGAQISGYWSFWPDAMSSPGPSQRTLACVPA